MLRAERARRVLAASGYLSRRRRLPDFLGRSHRAPELSLPFADIDGRALLFRSARGRSLRDLLLHGEPLPDPARIARLPGDFAQLFAEGSGDRPAGRRDVPRLAQHSCDLLSHLLPDVEHDVRRIVEAVLDGWERESVVPPQLVHGDFYEAQLFIDEDFSLGLIDLDDIGGGDPALDAANFCAHLVALAMVAPRADRMILAYRSLVREAFLDRFGISSESFAWREALCMVLLASGPFRVQRPSWPTELKVRVELAVRLLKDH